MKQNKITVETIIRTIVVMVALINQILAICGKEALPLYESDIVQIITLVATIASSLWAWWKNNSFTQNAIAADKYKDRLNAKQAPCTSEEELPDNLVNSVRVPRYGAEYSEDNNDEDGGQDNDT